MYIGLIDYDAFSSPSRFFPNLEIMKLSSFFKKDKNIVKLILNFSNLDRYSKFYLRKNIGDDDYPSSLIIDNRCEYGGLAFTRNSYVPLDEEIEKSVPDFQIYEKYYSSFNNFKSIKDRKGMLNKSCFIRLFYNDKLKDYYKNCCTPSYGGSIFIYDMDLFKKTDCIDILDNIGNNTHIKFIYPQMVKDKENCANICTKKWNYNKNKIILESNLLLNKDFKDFCDYSKDFRTRAFFLVGNDKNKTYTEIYLKNELNRTLNRAIYAIVMGSKLTPYCNREIPQSNYRKALIAVEDWVSLNFIQRPFKDYVKKDKGLSIFVENLSKKDSFFRELISVNPKKILDLGGKWIL